MNTSNVMHYTPQAVPRNLKCADLPQSLMLPWITLIPKLDKDSTKKIKPQTYLLNQYNIN